MAIKHESVFESISEFIINKHTNQSGAIYSHTDKDCESVAAKLKGNYGLNISYFHAGMRAYERDLIQREWHENRIQIIVVTGVFVKGIDKADVRFMLHYTVPSSLNAYYAKTSCAGRDGLPATCRLYFGVQDVLSHEYFIDQGGNNWHRKSRQKESLEAIVKYAGNDRRCRKLNLSIILVIILISFMQENV